MINLNLYRKKSKNKRSNEKQNAINCAIRPNSGCAFNTIPARCVYIMV